MLMTFKVYDINRLTCGEKKKKEVILMVHSKYLLADPFIFWWNQGFCLGRTISNLFLFFVLHHSVTDPSNIQTIFANMGNSNCANDCSL